MTIECPFCRMQIHCQASVCNGCGAKYGYLSFENDIISQPAIKDEISACNWMVALSGALAVSGICNARWNPDPKWSTLVMWLEIGIIVTVPCFLWFLLHLVVLRSRLKRGPMWWR